MDLTSLQVELRSIEEHVASLQAEIEKMKPQTGKEEKNEFEKITRIAMQSPIKGTSISKADNVTQKEYIRCLSWLMVNSEGELYDKLLYLSEIASGCKENISAEEIYRFGLEVEKEDIARMHTDFKELKYPFLVDAMILLNISGQASKKDFSMLADMALVLECDKEEIEIVATVTKAVLTKNFDVLRCLPVSKRSKWNGKFSQYISEEWLASQRNYCGALHIYDSGLKQMVIPESDKVKEVMEILQNGTSVQAKAVLVELRMNYLEEALFGCLSEAGAINSENTKTFGEKIFAPCSGILYFVRDKEKKKKVDEKGALIEEYSKEYIYVISQFDTYDALCEWHKNRQRSRKK